MAKKYKETADLFKKYVSFKNIIQIVSSLYLNIKQKVNFIKTNFTAYLIKIFNGI